MTDQTPALGPALRPYDLPWLQLDWPLDWRALFENENSLTLEIGFGNSAFLIEQAKRHPLRNHVGIERSWRSVQRLVRSACRHELDNVRVLQGDAPWMLRYLFAPDSLDEVFVNFSDPWPKEKHHGRRIIQPEFTELLAGRLCMDGRVTIATDHAGYAEWILHVLDGQRWLLPALDRPVVHELEGRFLTKYERKALAAGRTIYYFVWRKMRPTPNATVARSEVEPMPNVQLQGHAPLAALLEALPAQTWREAGQDVVIRLERAYRLFGDDHEALLEVKVMEGALVQQLAILILLKPEGGVLIKPASIGFPRPTWGVKRAVWRVADALLNAHPQLTVASSTVGDLQKERQ